MLGRESKGYIVAISTFRKSKGGKRDGRSNSSGKVGRIFKDVAGVRGEQVFVCEGPNFKDVSRQLRGSGIIPTYVTIDARKETRF